MGLTSFYSKDELKKIPFRAIGKNVCISRKCSLYKPEAISIGNHVRIDDFCILSGGNGIQIGNYVHIAAYSALYANQGILIQDFSNISSRVVIYTCSDDYDSSNLTNPAIPVRYRQPAQGGPVHIGRHVIIGTASTIMPTVKMEEGSALGAHSFLKTNTKSWSLYAGVPARFLKKRDPKVLELEKQLTSEGA